MNYCMNPTNLARFASLGPISNWISSEGRRLPNGSFFSAIYDAGEQLGVALQRADSSNKRAILYMLSNKSGMTPAAVEEFIMFCYAELPSPVFYAVFAAVLMNVSLRSMAQIWSMEEPSFAVDPDSGLIVSD